MSAGVLLARCIFNLVLTRDAVSAIRKEVTKLENKTLFNFYLDPSLKKEAMEKLERLNGEKTKGQLSALLRVYIKSFIATPDEKVSPTLMEAVEAEYEYSLVKNKRSRL